MEISKSLSLQYYKRKEIQEAIIHNAKDKEVAISFGLNKFGKRPDILKYPNDVLELAKKGVSSFHVSEEIWKNPLKLGIDLKREEVNKLRKGWDLVLDIDCKELEFSKFAADLLIKALHYQEINSVSCKFSGNHGFHIGVPFESFPETVHNIEVKDFFPEGPRKIAAYLKEMIKKALAKALLEKYDIKEIAEKVDKKLDQIIVNNIFDPFNVLDIDTILISPRHLYRSAYSFNEKSGLVSLPIDPKKVLEFDKNIATAPDVEVSKFIFLDTSNTKKGEAKKLFIQSFDFAMKQEQTRIEDENLKKQTTKEYEIPEEAVPEKFFPPCILNTFKGIKDGKKRAVFALINFLTSLGWEYDQIEERLKEWNENNFEPLREVYIKGQIRYNKTNKKKILPPNCKSEMYYKDLGVCKPDGLCKYIKNPVNYAKIKAKKSNNP